MKSQNLIINLFIIITSVSFLSYIRAAWLFVLTYRYRFGFR